MFFDGAEVGGFDDGGVVIFRKFRGELYFDGDFADHFEFVVHIFFEKEFEALGVYISFLTEAQDIDTGASGDRNKEEVERGGGGGVTTVFFRLVGVDGEAFVEGVHFLAAGEGDFHIH